MGIVVTGRSVVLRRRSWSIIFGTAAVGLGTGMFAAVLKVSSMSGFRTGWQGIPAYLLIAGLIGRIVNCKVVMRDGVLTVVNPLRTHTVAKAVIESAAAGDDGGLEVALSGGRSVAVFAYGGSFIDHFRGTSGAAAATINRWLRTGPEPDGASVDVAVSWTRCRPADLSVLGGVLTAGGGALWMALTGG
ncbi:hypothetical protein HCK00_13745 [Streptomyces sp. PLAI1-29]|uniref:PH domain-containing protein n=1 Tax=Streptomyces zingiberis TaxID=2053010 RepID=A0ABX1BYR4_9ACTN|nr:hypothetical protein [Streptomyces zingiberis]